jgi:hypothetical protein
MAILAALALSCSMDSRSSIPASWQAISAVARVMIAVSWCSVIGTLLGIASFLRFCVIGL